MTRIGSVIVALALCIAGVACRSGTRPDGPRRISMEALHAAGGVPPGWHFSLEAGNPDAGRQVFIEYGCHSCHTIQGEQFPPLERTPGIGPDLTGMGSHHPPEYFAESILNPNSVLVDGEGYVARDGRSTMPDYPEMTLAELTDVVAYLRTLVGGGERHDAPHQREFASPAEAAAERDAEVSPPPLPSPPANPARAFFTRVYEVRPGMLPEYGAWFRRECLPALMAFDGALSVHTYVDRTRPRPAMLLTVSFANADALNRFIARPPIPDRFYELTIPLDDVVLSESPLYEVPEMSAGAPKKQHGGAAQRPAPSPGRQSRRRVGDS